MIFRFSDKNIIINRFWWLILFFLSLLSSCSSNQKKVIEIITPPKSPNDFSFIPEQTYNPELQALISADQKIKDIIVGRYDPFLPPHSKGNQLLIPDSFKFHGQIASEDVVNAFVSYQNERGTIKVGDIGGETTNLLPTGWHLEKLDTRTQVLTLTHEDRAVNIDLFPQ